LLLLLVACHREQATAPLPHQGPRVIFVGLDGADWQLLDRFTADGTMPNLATLVRDGARGPLLTQHPPLSPLVWTTMMTGLSPLEHRILDFTRFNPATRQREPITSDERAVPAIWNMLSSSGRRVDVVGLWATYPAESVDGAIVSDRLFSFQYDAAAPPHSVSPASEEAWAKGIVQDVAAQMGFEVMHRYVPSLKADEYARLAANPNPFAHPITALRRIVIETEVMHRLGVERIEKDKPDLAIVYFQGTDAIGHLLAPNVPRAYFARIDAILGDYRRLAEKTGATLVIASDHGFDWDKAPAKQAADSHRDEGIYLQWPRRANALPRSVADICPTLLELLGMPRDVRSYRRAYRRAEAAAPAPAASEEIAKLKALGYIGGSEPSSSGGSSTRTAGSYSNEGLILRNLGRADDAIAAFESALRVDPKNASAMWNLSRSLLLRGKDALKRKECAAALTDFTRATELAPNDALAFASRGTAQLCLGDERGARASFRRSLDIDPNQPLY